MSVTFLAGATSQSVDVFLKESSSTVGAGLAGLVYNTASLTAYYRIGATGTATAITLATQTVGGAWSSGGFVEIDATNTKGLYRLDIPDAVLASAALVTIYVQGAANLAPTPLRIDCRPVAKVTLTDTLTTYTGNTVQTGDSFARLGAAGAGLTDLGGMSTTMKGQVNAEADTALTDYDPPTNAEMEARTLVAASYFDPAVDVVANVTLVDTTTTNTDMRGTDSAALATSLTTAQADLDIITGADGVNLLSGTQASIDAIEAVDVLGSQMTEAYAADGVAPTLTEAIMLLLQRQTEFAISGTTITIKKLDGTTTAATLTMDSDTAPTSSTRAT